ncbi:MAG: class I SAM-dependent methyltransferase [Actinobacteria bacterium]|nr:class I SAM-dependent methyltransferase [Actinomycetota bacterium]MCA1721257.1 class I SAM-dependent methyltransferase [Actinomycetota bacterium]
MTKPKRYAAGRARALGLPTRGTTAPNRLRRVDRWIASTYGDLLRSTPEPLVVDLGYGATPVTAVELHARLSQLNRRVQVVGIEIDPERVAAAKPAERPGLTFRTGGFELAGLRPVLVRALNVLRQYEEQQAAEAWQTLLTRTQILVEGTCDEIGRRAAWVDLAATGPRTLTLAAHLPTLQRPSDLAERLPKALIHHNVPGARVHALLTEFDAAWDRAAPYAAFGNRQRWTAACDQLDFPKDTRRARFGELTVPWESVAP